MGMKHTAGDQNGGCGENLAVSTDLDLMENKAGATEMWYNELNDPGYTFDPPTGFTSGTGHFT